ncbi:hypothetical protein Y032_0242g3442 [Ancylostoma ceylanicum]|uniref:Uncharacterized protein n=1 Tax=Ancylostoma ceylanicum TaxID=53326 RepID=A0A016SDJ8_9BILA|nr:hypothetical protein Y032_0242g3442 [Ancylostoma ceylanicum]
MRELIFCNLLDQVHHTDPRHPLLLSEERKTLGIITPGDATGRAIPVRACNASLIWYEYWANSSGCPPALTPKTALT